jgi:GntR family L-lactate dehydrogenase operon transcriptional regulator
MPTIVEQLTDQLEQIVRSRGLVPGDRLPSERQLSQDLDVSRSSLREAIQKLQSRGVLETRRGGGTYVSQPPEDWTTSAIVTPLAQLIQDNPEYRFDVLEIRHALEGSAAWHAALRATPEDKLRIRACFDRMIAGHGSDNPLDEPQADAEFHLAIAEASHNLILLQVMRGLFHLLQVNVTQNLSALYQHPRVFEPLSGQHRALMDAVIDGDPQRARAAAQEHLEFVHETLRRDAEDQARRARSFRLPGGRT